ncbi:MAG: AfsR/SARP family transcriptional regulator, partial [Micromonosporaceae bacterium]
FLAAALTAGGADDPHARAQVVIPAATLATLLGADAVTLPDTPRLTVAPGLPEALDTLDHATLHRTRLAYEHEATTVAEIRHDDPTEEPLPPLLLIADADAAHERARIAALLTQGRRLDVHAVLLGDWPTGHTLHVNTEGTTNPTRPAPHADQQPAVNGCLAVLTPAETADLLTVLAESHTGHPPTPPPAEHAPSRPAHPEEDATPDEPRPVEGAPDPVAAIEGDDGENLTGDQQAPVQPSPTATQTTETQLDAGPALVSVLGAPRIHYNRPPPKEPFRGKARELLVYLAVNDGGATSNAILEDVYGDVPHSRAAHRLHVCVSNLRVHLTHAGGDSGHVQHPRHRYLLNPDEVDTDLRRMQRALADYERGADDPTRIDGLRRAVDAYTGPLADGYEYDWIEPAREAVRRQALDAHLALADLLAPTDPDQALHVLHTAIEHGPHDEAIYRQAMRLYAAKGDTPGLRSLLRSLTERLADIDMEPDETTTDLANQLMAQLRQGKRG